MRIAMVGAGYVGLVSGACFAEFGVEVCLVDTDAAKVAALREGRIPIYEPGLDRLVQDNVREGRLVSVKGLVEKPPPEKAPSNLTIIGRYVLMPEVIDALSEMERSAGGEVQLTDGMAKLIGRQPFHGLRYEGRRFDCGDKTGFLEAQIAFALKRPDMAPAVREFLARYC